MPSTSRQREDWYAANFPQRRLGEFRRFFVPISRPLSQMQTLVGLGISNYTNTSHTRRHTLHVAQRFEIFLDTYRRPDGSR
jgi:hypothetical protein